VARRVYYLVTRLGWGSSGELQVTSYDGERSGPVPVGLYKDRATAEARARAAERELQSALSPFCLSWRLDKITGLPWQKLREGLAALGVPDTESAPATDQLDGGEWSEWWARVADRLTDEQRAAVWALFDRAKLFEVSRVEVRV
jgi:hypothetical protein